MSPAGKLRAARPRRVLLFLRDWLVARDPGFTSLRRAVRTTISVLGAVLTTYALMHLIGSSAGLVPDLMAGMVALFSTFAVNDPTARERFITVLLFTLVIASAVFLGALVSPAVLLANLCLLAVIFLAFFVRRFGTRFMPLGMGAFMGFYFASLLHASVHLMPTLWIAIGLGAGWGALGLFVLLPDAPRKATARMRQTFYADAATVMGEIQQMLTAPPREDRPPAGLRRSLGQLASVATDLANQLPGADDETSASAETRSLEYFIADTVIALETLAESAWRLDAKTRLPANLRDALNLLFKRLEIAFRERSVRSQAAAFDDIMRQVAHASESGPAADRLLRQQLTQRMLLAVRWLLESPTAEELAAYETDESERDGTAAGAPDSQGADAQEPADAPDSPPRSWKDRLKERLDASTIQAIQAVIAGIISIVVGYLLSPAHQYWTLLAAFVVLARPGTIGATYIRAVQRVVGTLVGALIGFGVAQLVAGRMSTEVGLAFICVFFGFYLFSVSYGLMVLFITIMLALMYDILLGNVQAQLLEARFFDTLIGAGIGLLISLLIFPNKTRDDVRQNVSSYFTVLSNYIAGALDSLLQSGTPHTTIAQTFELNAALQAARASLETLRKQPGAQSKSGADRLLAGLRASNYYARHLSDPFGRRLHTNLEGPQRELVEQMRGHAERNLQALCEVLAGNRDVEIQPPPLLTWGGAHAALPVHSAARDAAFVVQTRQPDSGSDATGERARDESDERALRRTLHFVWHVDATVAQLARDLGART